jgi:hypothetical protein
LRRERGPQRGNIDLEYRGQRPRRFVGSVAVLFYALNRAQRQSCNFSQVLLAPGAPFPLRTNPLRIDLHVQARALRVV